MVTTRRTAANAIAATNRSNTKPVNTHAANETNRAVYMNTKVVNTAESSSPVHDISPIDSISEHDLSLTSPPQHQDPQSPIMNPPGPDVQNLVHHDPGPASTRRALAPKPHGVAGSVNNPISMLDDSPPKKSAHGPTIQTKRKYNHHQLLEPHKFVDNGYRKLYSYRQTRPAVVPQPANGTTFTGHQNQDAYRALNAKVVAATAANPRRVYGPVQKLVPFEEQFPKSAEFLARIAATNPCFSDFSQYHGVPVPGVVYRQFPTQTEALLRRKALQYVREYSRPTPRKRALSDVDPDETSTSESEALDLGLRKTSASSTPHVEVAAATPKLSVLFTPKFAVTPKPTTTTMGASTSAPASTPILPSIYTPRLTTSTTASVSISAPPTLSARQKGKLSVYRDTNTASASSTINARPNTLTAKPKPTTTNTTDLPNLIEHTTLLASLLTLYPSSCDKSGLREDIAMLVSVQNQRLEAWHVSETNAARREKRGYDTRREKRGYGGSGEVFNTGYPEAYTGRGALLRKQEVVRVKAVEKAREQKNDEQMRGLLSAGAGLWQDGSGDGVVEVFAEREGKESDGSRASAKVGHDGSTKEGQETVVVEKVGGQAVDTDMVDVQ